MKIEDKEGNIIDTDKMNDMSAQLAEKSQELFEFCETHGVTAILAFRDPVLNKVSGFQSYDVGSEEENMIINTLNGFFKKDKSRFKIYVKMKGDE